MDSLFADLRHAVRTLRRNPGLVLVSVVSLGLGLGVNLALFSVVRAAFFYQPDIIEPDQVVGVQPGNSNQFSYLNYRDLQDSGIFESVVGFRLVRLNLRSTDETEQVNVLAVTANFFESLGTLPSTGRVFGGTEAEAERQPRVAVLAYEFWQGRLGGDRGIVGRSLTINGEPFDVIGVLPEHHRPVTPLEIPDLYVPLSDLVLPTIGDRRNGNALAVLGRLGQNVTREQVRVATTQLGAQLAQAYPDANRGMEQPAQIVPLRVREFGNWQEPALISATLFLLVGLVLLSACANVAGLLLAKAAQHRREIAVRMALGAKRGRLIRMLLTESLGLALLGAAAGAGLFLSLARVLDRIALPAMVGSATLRLSVDTGVIAYAFVLTFLTALLCGLVPAWRATQANLFWDIKTGDGHTSTGRTWLRHGFVVGQVTAAVVLLVLSALLLQTVTRVTTLDPGFDVDRVAVAMVNVDPDRYAADGGLPLSARLIERIEALPGVERASVAGIVALGMDASATFTQAEGQSEEASVRAFINSVGPGYFQTLGIPLVAGRDFAPGDRQGAPAVAIINEALAEASFPGQNALGKQIRELQGEEYREIVGIVRNSKYRSVTEAPTPILYMAYTQEPHISTQIRPVIIHARTTNPPASMLPSLRRAVADVDPTVSANVQTLRAATGGEAALRRFGTRMLGAVGLVALLLASIGLYGAIAFVVSSRTREIGTRVALGARPGRIVGGVMGQGLRLVAAGVAVGTVLTWMLSSALASVLAGVSPADPVAYAGATLSLVIVSLLALYLPARRAASVNPVEALRLD